MASRVGNESDLPARRATEPLLGSASMGCATGGIAGKQRACSKWPTRCAPKTVFATVRRAFGSTFTQMKGCTRSLQELRCDKASSKPGSRPCVRSQQSRISSVWRRQGVGGHFALRPLWGIGNNGIATSRSHRRERRSPAGCQVAAALTTGECLWGVVCVPTDRESRPSQRHRATSRSSGQNCPLGAVSHRGGCVQRPRPRFY
jgi:hypothetical protein